MGRSALTFSIFLTVLFAVISPCLAAFPPLPETCRRLMSALGVSEPVWLHDSYLEIYHPIMGRRVDSAFEFETGMSPLPLQWELGQGNSAAAYLSWDKRELSVVKIPHPGNTYALK